MVIEIHSDDGVTPLKNVDMSVNDFAQLQAE